MLQEMNEGKFLNESLHMLFIVKHVAFLLRQSSYEYREKIQKKL